MCASANIDKTNHSLRATGATELFRAGVPEKIIQQRTGHMSLKGLHIYERTTIDQHKAGCDILQSKNSNPSYHTSLECHQQQQQQYDDSASGPIHSAKNQLASATTNIAVSQQSRATANGHGRNVYNNCTFNISIQPHPFLCPQHQPLLN